jgi:hypothetical protein
LQINDSQNPDGLPPSSKKNCTLCNLKLPEIPSKENWNKEFISISLFQFFSVYRGISNYGTKEKAEQTDHQAAYGFEIYINFYVLNLSDCWIE